MGYAGLTQLLSTRGCVTAFSEKGQLAKKPLLEPRSMIVAGRPPSQVPPFGGLAGSRGSDGRG
jgi:hypothetical protein